MADNITVLDSNSAEQTVRTTDDGTAHTPHHIFAGVAATVKRAAVSISASGALVSAVASNKIKVLGLFLMADADIDVEINDGSGGSALIGEVSLASDGHGFVLPVAPVGSHWIETSTNTALYATITGTGNLSGVVVYHEEA